MLFNIITPCSRPDNLPKLFESLKTFSDKLVWYIVHDSLDKRCIFNNKFNWIKEFSFHLDGGVAGHAQRNFALDLIESGYVYQLDDDNLLHPYLIPAIELRTERAITFAQIMDKGRIRLGNSIRQTFIDQAQFILDRTLIGDCRYNPYNYCGDGEFIEELYNKHKDDFVTLSSPLCFYNALNWM